MTYDQIDAQGTVTRSAITLGPYDVLPPGSQWVPHVVTAVETDALAAFNALQASDDAAKQASKAEAVIQYLVTHTPAECDAYVHANVTNLATAVNLLGKMAMALSVLARAELR
jgi:hypothetical protein